MPYQSTLPQFPEQDGVRFRLIPGWTGYAVTDSGEVWSCRNRKKPGWFCPHWTKLKPTHHRWWSCVYFFDGRGRAAKKTVKIHRLVMLCFAGPCPKGKEVAHNNGNPNDNRLENLRYDTRQNNAMDAYLHGTGVQGETHGMHKLTEEKVREIREKAAAGTPIRQIAFVYHRGCSTIASVVHRRTWKHVD
jgi:hypothetical protein